MSVGKLTGPKKAAILLLALGEDAAADVMKNLEESEIQQVGYYMSRFTDVAPEELDILILKEYLFQQRNYLEKLKLSVMFTDFQ